MTGVETKIIAGATVKITDSVVKLFFASQIENLKKNLKEKFVEKQISNKNIELIFKKYLTSLYKNCYTVDTIMFPLHEIILEEIYEPLSLMKDIHLVDDLENCDRYITQAIHGDLKNNISIIDTAGMGKSTFSKYLILKILKNTSHKQIPIFIELRKINDNETLVEYIVKDINLEYQNIFTDEMLFKLMEKGSFFFVLDGFDEVDDERNQMLGKEISTLSKNFSDNVILLTSRKQPYTPSLYNSITLNFKPLNLEQIKSLILKYDKCVGIEVGKKLIKHKNFSTLNYELFNTPLMVNLLYKLFGYNNTIDSNIVTFYDEMFNALYKGHDLTKAGFLRKKISNLNSEDFRALFNAFCFVSLLENKTFFKTKTEALAVIKKASVLSSIEINRTEAFFEDLLSNVPFLTKDGLEFKFVHKTIIEFFAAEFLNHSSMTHSLIKKMRNNNLFVTFTKCFEFLYKINKSLYIREIGQEFLSTYIEYSKKKYISYNDLFKTILYFNNNMMISFQTEEYYSNEKNRDMHGYFSGTGFYMLFKNKRYVINILHENKNKFEYTPNLFFNSVLNIKSTEHWMSYLEEKKNTSDIENLIKNMEVNKFYKITAPKIKSLQNSPLLASLLLKVIFQNTNMIDEANGLFSIDIKKCKNILLQEENKLDILNL